MGHSPAQVVRAGLQAFADRKVFRNFVEEKGRNGTLTFRFRYFGDDLMTLDFVERTRTLVIRNMLPRVPVDMYRDLTAFLETLSDARLPPYRRIDRRWAQAGFVRTRGNVSLVFQVRKNRYKYGVEKLVNVASWIRTRLQGQHQEYLWKVMGEPED